MVATTLPPELIKVIRNIEVGRLQHMPSWRGMLPVEVVPPTYTVEHIKTDKQIVVTRSVRGDGPGGPRGTLTQDRESNKMLVFKTRMDIPWFDSWMATQRAASGALPIPVGPLDSINPQRLFAEMLAELERDIDSFYWDGDTTESINGMLDQDASPASNTATLDTMAGRQELVDNIALARKDALLKFAVGQPVLAIDASLMHFLDFPYQDGGGANGKSAAEVLRGTQPGTGLAIIPTQNPSMNGKALLTFRDPTNAVAYDSTPAGAVPLIFGDEGEDKQLVLFKQLGSAFRRDVATNKVWRTFDDLI